MIVSQQAYAESLETSLPN